MADRHADILAQIQNVHQLEAVVTAMRGIAAARAQHGRALLPGIDAYSDVISAAIGQALKDLADELCGGRLVFTLEGGYHSEALAYSILNTFAVLLEDDDWQLVDPLGPSPRRERPVDDVIERVRQIHGFRRKL